MRSLWFCTGAEKSQDWILVVEIEAFEDIGTTLLKEVSICYGGKEDLKCMISQLGRQPCWEFLVFRGRVLLIGRAELNRCASSIPREGLWFGGRASIWHEEGPRFDPWYPQ